MTVKIVKTRVSPLTKCRECEKRVFPGEKGITLVYGYRYIDKWNFHAHCFPNFREEIANVNIFEVTGV